jgi:hypothetical protein
MASAKLKAHSSTKHVLSHSGAGLDINACPIPVKTDVGQIDLVLRLSDGTSEQIRDSQTCQYDGQIYFHWYKILGLLYKRALFDLQFVHNLFWLKLKWNARSKLFYFIIYRSSMLWWSSRTLTKLKSQSQKRFNERKYQNFKYKNTPERTCKNYRISIWRQI